MKLADLLEEFNIVIDTKEGLSELRSLILGLAVRGKLVPQDPNDEPASELLKKIEAEKLKKLEKGVFKLPRAAKKASDFEKPYSIPNNWEWSCLNEIYDVRDGTHDTPSYQDKGIPLVTSKNLCNGQLDLTDVKYISKEDHQKISERSHVEKGDVLFAMIGTIGNSVIVNRADFSIKNVALFKFIEKKLSNSQYLKLFLDESEKSIIEVASGGVQAFVSLTFLRNYLMPLPPLAEQHRIVQKIESLFVEVDELEAKLNRQTKLDEKLQLAVNAEVQQAPDAEASQSAWNFITSHFDTLYHTPEVIDNLKKNILNEAVRGRLVPQNPNDEPASELLKKIEAEKQRLYEEGEIRKPKDLPPVKEDEIPFEVPGSWEWTHFEEAGVINPRNEADDEIEASFVSMSLISEGYMEMHDSETRQWKEIKSGYTHFAENDVGLAKITPCFQNGKAAIFRDLKNGIGAGTTELYVFRSIFGGLIPEYVYAFLKTSMYITNGVSKMTGTAGQQRVPREYFETIPFPLPPAEEQHRIVRRIEELFAICDRFKAQLEQRQAVNERLVKGLVGEVLEGS